MADDTNPIVDNIADYPVRQAGDQAQPGDGLLGHDADFNPQRFDWAFLREQLGIGAPEIFNAASPAVSGIKGVSDGQCYTENPTIYAYNRYRWFAQSLVWILVYQGIGAVQARPYVSLRQSVDNLTLGNSVTLLGTATSSNGPLTSVDLYSGTQLLHHFAPTDPFTFVYTPTQTGSYAFTLQATDTAGQTSTSSAQLLTVAPVGASTLPELALTAPATGSVSVALALSATATPATGLTITKGEFLVGSQVIATLTAAPFTANYTPTTAGTLNVSFRATDSAGGVSTITKQVVVAVLGGGDTPSPGPVVTPLAPTFANFSDTASGGTVTIVPNSGAPLSLLVYALPGSSQFIAVPSNGVVTVGSDVQGSLTAKTLAGTSGGITYAESPLGTSPAFTALPGAPVIGTATAGNATVHVTWAAPASNGGSPITGYKVYKVATGTVLATVGATTLAYDDNTATNGTAEQLQVSAVTAIGEGPKSAASNSATPSAPTPPTFGKTLTGPSEQEDTGTILTASAGDKFRFNVLPLGASDARRMNLLLPSGTQVATVDFLAPYNATQNQFSFQLDGTGTLYYGYFADGNVTLSTSF